MTGIDHPLIMIGQGIIAVAVFRLYFLLRDTPFPLPQLMLGLGVTVVANLVARSTGAPWFSYADMAQYCMLGAVTIAAIYTVESWLRLAPATKRVPVTDFFGRNSVRITWGVALIVTGLLLYNYVKSYEERQASRQQVTKAVVAENTRVRKQYAAELKARDEKDQAFKDSLKHQIDTLTKANATLLIGQGKIITTQRRVENKATQSAILQRKALQRAKPMPTPDKLQPVPPQKNEKRTFLQRVFGVRYPVDTTHYGELWSGAGAEAAHLTILH